MEYTKWRRGVHMADTYIVALFLMVILYYIGFNYVSLLCICVAVVHVYLSSKSLTKIEDSMSIPRSQIHID